MVKTLTQWRMFILFLCCPIAMRAAPIPVDGTAAVVNDQAITMTEVFQAMQPLRNQLLRNYKNDELEQKLKEAYQQTLQSLIDRKVILDTYKNQEKFTIPDSIVNMRIDELVHTKFNNSRAELLKTLESEGMTLDEWRTAMKNQMIVSVMRDQAVESKVAISPKSIRDDYEKNIEKYQVPKQVELRMIVIHRGNTNEEIALKTRQAKEILKRLAAGEPFETLAKEVSEGIKASTGGYWGWIEPSTRRPELADVLATLNPGEVSNVISAGESLYILKVESRKNASVIPFKNIQESIQLKLKKEKAQQFYDNWLKSLKQKSYIKKY